MSVALRLSVPRRYSTWTLSPGSSERARSINFMPGPESSSFSDSAPPSAVPLKRVITSPALRPAFSAGPPGVMPSIRAPTLSPVASARVSTTTPIRPRLSENANTLPGPLSTRTRGREGRRGAACANARDGMIMLAAMAAKVHVRIILTLLQGLEPDVANAGRAGVHQFPHQIHALLP